MKIRKSAITRIIIHIIAWSVALIWILPFVGVFMASIRPIREISHGWWNFADFNPSFKSFVDVWNHEEHPLGYQSIEDPDTGEIHIDRGGIVNSFTVAIPATIIPMLVASLAGYGFARFSFPIRDYLFLIIVLIMAIPQQMIAVPITRIMYTFGLMDSHVGLILVHSAWGLAWIILFMRNYFSTLPVEIEEAAKVDGASDFKIFYKIVLPMALPALASVAVLQFMWVWNDFFLAQILILSDPKLLVTQRIPRLRGQQYVPWGLLSAGSILAMLVPILIYVLLQKYYIRGMIGWTVKG